MRRATKEDIPRLVELGQAMHAESRFRDFRFNVTKVERLLAKMIDGDRFVVLVDGAPLHAMFLGAVHEFWWGDDLQSEDIVLYVSPEKRGGTSAVRLVREYKRIAESMNVSDPIIGTGTGIDMARTGKFFERIGAEPIGLTFTLKSRNNKNVF